MKSKMDKYERQEKIGQGAYGSVYKAINLETNEIVAIKRVIISDENEGIPYTSIREMAILKRYNHKNIVQLLEINFDPRNKRLYLIFEYMDYDLRKYLDINKNLSVYQQKSIMNQILKGVQYLHEKRIFHRDLKPQNILVNKKGCCKIADFGLSRTIQFSQNSLTQQIQTLWYRAPEILLRSRKYSLPVDIWSIGCIFSEIVHGIPLFSGDCEISQIFKIFEFHGTPNDYTWQTINDLPLMKKSFPQFENSLIYQQKQCPKFDLFEYHLFSKLISLDPEERISCKMALNHKYFNGFQADLQ